MRSMLLLAVLCLCGLGSGVAFAASGHYANGGEGVLGANVPPPRPGGFYWKIYNMYYAANSMRDNGRGEAPGDFSINILAQAHRFIYSSGIEILGGNLLFDLIVPITYTDISYKEIGPASFDDTCWGVGDVFIEPVFIGWHRPRWDAFAAIGAYLPTGIYDADKPASPGMGFWTMMFSAGGVWYFDAEKSWSASILARYQVHTEQIDTNITPGDHFSFEWGLGKTLSGFSLGIAGYCHWQVSDDSGPGTNSHREQAFAMGPEIGYTFEDLGINVVLRSVWEFENKNKAQGSMTSLNVVYAF